MSSASNGTPLATAKTGLLWQAHDRHASRLTNTSARLRRRHPHRWSKETVDQTTRERGRDRPQEFLNIRPLPIFPQYHISTAPSTTGNCKRRERKKQTSNRRQTDETPHQCTRNPRVHRPEPLRDARRTPLRESPEETTASAHAFRDSRPVQRSRRATKRERARNERSYRAQLPSLGRTRDHTSRPRPTLEAEL